MPSLASTSASGTVHDPGVPPERTSKKVPFRSQEQGSLGFRSCTIFFPEDGEVVGWRLCYGDDHLEGMRQHPSWKV